MKVIRPEIRPFMVQAHMDLGSDSGVGCNSNQLKDGTWEFNWEEKIGFTPPTDAEIKTRADEFQIEWDAQEYARNRKEEYIKLDQFEMQYDDQVNGTTTWIDAIDAIKAKYPKPE